MVQIERFNQFLQKTLRQELRGRLRVWLGWIIAPIFIYNLHQMPSLLGIILVLMGASLRMWASGCIEKESRLSMNGPFRYSRNPLYIGSLLMTLGFFFTQDFYIAGVAFTLFSLMVYHPLIKAEESVLLKKFPGNFENYINQTPRYFSFRIRMPSLLNKVDLAQTRPEGFSRLTFKKNRGSEPLWVALSMLVGLATFYQIELFIK